MSPTGSHVSILQLVALFSEVELSEGRVHLEEVDHRDGVGLGDIAQFTSCPIYVLSLEVCRGEDFLTLLPARCSRLLLFLPLHRGGL